MVGQIDHVGEEKRLKKDFGGFFILLLRKDREWFRSNGAFSPCRGVHFESVCQVLWRGKIRYVCVYLLHKCGRWSVPGFPRLSDNFVSWGLELKELQQNIYAPDGSIKINSISTTVCSSVTQRSMSAQFWLMRLKLAFIS